MVVSGASVRPFSTRPPASVAAYAPPVEPYPDARAVLVSELLCGRFIVVIDAQSTAVIVRVGPTERERLDVVDDLRCRDAALFVAALAEREQPQPPLPLPNATPAAKAFGAGQHRQT